MPMKKKTPVKRTMKAAFTPEMARFLKEKMAEEKMEMAEKKMKMRMMKRMGRGRMMMEED